MSRLADRCGDLTSVWTASADVATCEHGGRIVLMSLSRRSYHTLDQVGTAVWRILNTGKPIRAVAAETAALYGLSPDSPRVLSDVVTLVDDLSRRDLLTKRGPPDVSRASEGLPQRDGSVAAVLDPSAPAIPPPRLMTCVIATVIIHCLLRTVGLARVLRLLRYGVSRKRCEPEPHVLAQYARRTAVAAALCPFRAVCLDHSVTLLWLLRRAGVEADLRLGVQPFPFSAHAWVEYAGTPVNEAPEFIAMYRMFSMPEGLLVK